MDVLHLQRGFEGLFVDLKSHPSPVRRTMRVLKQALPDNDEFGSAMWLLAATHIARLARLQNRPGADQIVDGNFTTIKDSFDILKQCW
jgi:aminopeptidase N